jgi:hypothetical protein
VAHVAARATITKATVVMRARARSESPSVASTARTNLQKEAAMAIAYVQEFDASTDRTTANYDAVKAKLNVESDPPEGMIIHTAGFTAEGVFRIFDVWDSEEQHGRFMKERLLPAIEAMTNGAGADRPHEYTYLLHDVVRS